MNIKKRTSLDSMISKPQNNFVEDQTEQNYLKEKEKIKQLSAYLPEPVYEQMRTLAFQERKKIHDYIIEGLNLVFAHRGLKSVEELKNK